MDRFIRAGKAVEALSRVMARLRAPDGCPWDREQDLQTLKQYLIEETYETVDAIDSGDPDAHREELGDLLLQVVFQAEVTQSEGRFDLADVATTIHDKLIRRHPHVFGDTEATDADGALASWEGVKAQERERAPVKKSSLAGIPRAMPALARAYRSGEKAAAVGFDWPDTGGVAAKVEEEWAELRAASPQERAEELGDLLFAIVNLSRHWKIDPEDALRRATDKFHDRFGYVERKLASDGRLPSDSSLDEMNELWEEAKSAGAQEQRGARGGRKQE